MANKKLEFYKEGLAELDGGVSATRWRIREWKPVYTKILVLYGKGMSTSQIAQEAEVGYSVGQLKKIVQDPLFRLKLTQYTKKMDVAIVERATEELTRVPEIELAKIKLAEAAEKAADTIIALLDPDSELYTRLCLNERRLMLSICQDMLNRSGLKTLLSTEETKQGRDYSPDEIRSALDNAKELEEIAARLDGRNSSFILTKEERRDVSPAPLVEEAGSPDFIKNTAFEQTEAQPTTLEQPEQVLKKEVLESNTLDESSS